MPGFQKTGRSTPQIPAEKKQQQPEERTIPIQPRTPTTDNAKAPPPMRIVTTVLALCLLAAPTWAATVISAPQGNKPAVLFPFTDQFGVAALPGGLSGPGVGVNVQHFGANPNTLGGTVDSTTQIQAAIDDPASSVLKWPMGSYYACGLIPRGAGGQIWIGDGPEETFLTATSGCANLIVNNGNSGPEINWEISGFTLRSNLGSTNVINLDGNNIMRAYIHDNFIDVAFNQLATGSGGTNGIIWGGGYDLQIEHNFFYGSLPGYGKAITLLRQGRQIKILNNDCRWTYQFVEAANTNGTTDLLIQGNTIDLGWYAEPVKITNSGGTVTYAATTLTDTSAPFTGLCNDQGTPPDTCNTPAAEGNFVRVMTPIVTGTTGNFTNPGIITDAAGNYVVNGVARGNIIRSDLVCRGNGTLQPNKRRICTATAGTAGWGDSCVCTSNADCSSNVCERRMTTVTGPVSATVVAVDGWVSDVDRRPQPGPGGIGNYTIYSWVIGQVGSYTSTVITLGPNNTNWYDWFGTTSTPGAGTLFEVLTHHPNYPILINPNAYVQKGRIIGNTINRPFSDAIALQTIATGQDWQVIGNQIADGQDIGIDLFPAGSIAANNVVDHQGTQGISASTTTDVHDNTVQDTTWTNNQNTTSLGDIQTSGGANVHHNTLRQTIAMANHRYGLISTGAAARFEGNSFAGAWTVGNFRINGGGATANHLVDYQGEVVSNNGGTFSIEGGYSTQALITANTPLGGSYCGCSNCTVAAPTAAGGTGAMAIYSTTGPQWNGR